MESGVGLPAHSCAFLPCNGIARAWAVGTDVGCVIDWPCCIIVCVVGAEVQRAVVVVGEECLCLGSEVACEDTTGTGRSWTTWVPAVPNCSGNGRVIPTCPLEGGEIGKMLICWEPVWKTAC